MLKFEEKTFIYESIKNKNNLSEIFLLFERETKIENNFLSINEFYNLLLENRDIFNFLYLGFEIPGFKKRIKKSILLANFYDALNILKGRKSLLKINPSKLNNFQICLIIIEYLTLIFNEQNSANLLFDFNSLFYRNYFNFYNFEIPKTEKKILRQLFCKLGLSFWENYLILKSNFNKKQYVSKQTFYNSLSRAINATDAFNFSRYKSKPVSFDEKLLFDFLKIKINEDFSYSPFSNFGNNPFPDLSMCTEINLNILKNSHATNSNALYIIETIDFLKNENIPTESTLIFYIDHFCSLLERNKIYELDSICNLLCGLSVKKVFNGNVKKYFILKAVPILEKKKGCHEIVCKLVNSKIYIGEKLYRKYQNHSKKLFRQLISKAHTTQGLFSLLYEDEIRDVITEKNLLKILNCFNEVIESGLNGIRLAALYVEMGKLLNCGVCSKIHNIEFMKSELIKSWQTYGYSATYKGFQKTEFKEELKVDIQKAIESVNKNVLLDERSFAFSICSHDQKVFKNLVVEGSKSPLGKFITHIDCNKTFPKNVKYVCKDNLAEIISNEIEFYLSIYSYNLLNDFKPELYIGDYYSYISYQVGFQISLFTEEEKLYSKIKKEHPSFSLGRWKKNRNYSDLCQLFPLIENEIIKNGLLNNICTVTTKDGNFDINKEPSTILLNRIRQIKKIYGNLNQASDLIFVYLMLYDKYCFNIRNTVIHGNDYPISNEKLDFNFKITLICLGIILKRNRLENRNI